MSEGPLPGPTSSSVRCSPQTAVSGQSQSVDDEKDEQMSKALGWFLKHLTSAHLLKDPCEVLLKDPCEVLYKPPCLLSSCKATGAADLCCLLSFAVSFLGQVCFLLPCQCCADGVVAQSAIFAA